MTEEGFVHSIDCNCGGCRRIRAMLKASVDSGKIFLSGTPEDKEKIMRAYRE